jgi:hypothetical protein
MRHILLAITAILLTRPMQAQTITTFRVSQATFIASQAADLASNWSGPEANPFLANHAGRMGAKGRAIKIGFTAGVVVLENWAVRKWPKSRKAWAAFNFIVGGAHTSVAVSNWRMK